MNECFMLLCSYSASFCHAKHNDNIAVLLPERHMQPLPQQQVHYPPLLLPWNSSMLEIAASLLLLNQVPEEKYMRAFQSRLREKNPGPHVVLHAARFRFNTEDLFDDASFPLLLHVWWSPLTIRDCPISLCSCFQLSLSQMSNIINMVEQTVKQLWLAKRFLMYFFCICEK